MKKNILWEKLEFNENSCRTNGTNELLDLICSKGWVGQLIEFTESGRMVPEKHTHEIRELVEGNYRIFYRLQKEKDNHS